MVRRVGGGGSGLTPQLGVANPFIKSSFKRFSKWKRAPSTWLPELGLLFLTRTSEHGFCPRQTLNLKLFLNFRLIFPIILYLKSNLGRFFERKTEKEFQIRKDWKEKVRRNARGIYFFKGFS